MAESLAESLKGLSRTSWRSPIQPPSAASIPAANSCATISTNSFSAASMPATSEGKIIRAATSQRVLQRRPTGYVQKGLAAGLSLNPAAASPLGIAIPFGVGVSLKHLRVDVKRNL